ncbi:MAG: hypothetical protein IT428_09690 [Planctomycetaceae bacterium]|nr:hypothetical protein [Planctomycetaceae bacterium]
MSTLVKPSLDLGLPRVSRGTLWFGTLGGGFAWLGHLMGAYVISEFGCRGGLNRTSWLGMTVVAWMLVALSGAMLLMAVVSTWVARASERRLETARDDWETVRSEADIARAGWMASGLFSLVILVQSIPIIYYLKHC